MNARTTDVDRRCGIGAVITASTARQMKDFLLCLTEVSNFTVLFGDSM